MTALGVKHTSRYSRHILKVVLYTVAELRCSLAVCGACELWVRNDAFQYFGDVRGRGGAIAGGT